MATFSSSYTYKPNVFENALNAYKKRLTPQITAPKAQTVNQSVQTPAVNQSKAPVIQGSGYGSNWSSNPSNYKKPVVIPKKTPTPPPVQQEQANPYLDRIRGIADKQSANVSQLTDQYATRNRESLERQNQRTASLIPKFQENFGRYRDSVNDQIADETKLSALDERAAMDNYGKSLRQGAQANRESLGQIQNIFGDLGTLDSNAFNKQILNQQSKFAGGQQELLNQRAKEVQTIKNDLSAYRRQAQEAVRTEEENLMARVTEIENTMDSRSVEYESAIAQAYGDAYNTLLAIDQNLAQLEEQSALADRDYELELKKAGMADKTTNLSETFLTTGQPTTREDYVYKLENPDNVTKAMGDGNQDKQLLLSVISSLKNGNIGGITGGLRYGFIPGSEAALTKNYYEQLKGLLSLENREKLKGSGAISNYESEVLERAASALGQNLSEDQFRAVLNDIETQLGGSSQVAMVGTDGKQYMVDASEVEEAAANGWRAI
jgi:hypothetical protein